MSLGKSCSTNNIVCLLWRTEVPIHWITSVSTEELYWIKCVSFDCYKFSFTNLLVVFSQKAIGLSLHETVHTKSTFSALRLSYSKEQSNTYGVRASNYCELLCYPAQGICLFFPTDLRHAVVWEEKKAGAQCLCRGPGKVHSPLGCTSSCNSLNFLWWTSCVPEKLSNFDLLTCMDFYQQDCSWSTKK